MSFAFHFSIGEEAPQGDKSLESSHDCWAAMDDDNGSSSRHPMAFVPMPFLCLPSNRRFTAARIGERSIQYLEDLDESRSETISDLVPGEYGGGKVVWECSLDLANYVLTSSDFLHSPSEQPRRVLELGCGHGIPGIAMLLRGGYSEVWFADLNREVLEEYTWPNIITNASSLALDRDVKCVSGDWKALSSFLSQQGTTFDVILSAETLYSEQTSQEVALFLHRHLSPGGRAFLATKRFYFGVGGGSLALTAAISSLNLSLQVVALQSFEDGASNIRDLLLVQRR